MLILLFTTLKINAEVINWSDKASALLSDKERPHSTQEHFKVYFYLLSPNITKLQKGFDAE